MVADTAITATNGLIYGVETVIITPSIGQLLASIIGSNAFAILVSETFSAMGAALMVSEVFAAEAGAPSLVTYLANPDVMSTVFAVPNLVFDMADISVEDFSPQEWYGILSHHIVSAEAALKATSDASELLDAATLTGGLFAEGKIVDGMIPSIAGGFLPLYIKHDASKINAAGGATGFGKGGGKGNGDERGRALLNRKDFGLVDKFDGNQSKFKSWLFDLLTALGSVDQALAKETKDMLKMRPKIVMDAGTWDIPDDVAIDFPIGQSPSNHKKV